MSALAFAAPSLMSWQAWCEECGDGINTLKKTEVLAWEAGHNEAKHPNPAA